MLNLSAIPAATRFIAERSRIIRRLQDKGIKGSPIDYRPERIVLGLLDSCGRRCNYCYLGDAERDGAVMPPELIDRAIGSAGVNGIPILVLTGGEPLMKLDAVLSAARTGGRYMDFLAVQTSGAADEETCRRLFEGLIAAGWKSRLVQFNLSWNRQRTAKETAQADAFIRTFAASSLRGRVVLSAVFEERAEEALPAFRAAIGNRLDGFEAALRASGKEFLFDPHYPMMVGGAKRHRGTPFGEVVRQSAGPRQLNFDRYRRLEQWAEDVIAVDPQGFVFPCGTYMYLGIYPIGRMSASWESATLSEMIAETCNDPIVRMIGEGRGEEVYQMACEIRPELRELKNVCADAAEIVVDLLEKPDTALQLLERAGNIIGKRSGR